MTLIIGAAAILSPMQFTHHTPGSIPSPAAITGSTLQIYSIKIKSIKGLNWPLRVYGEVAARDTVDRNRNILFSRSRFDYQELNGEVCSVFSFLFYFPLFPPPDYVAHYD